jgi:hypothetical protein
MGGSVKRWRVPALVGVVELSRLAMLALQPEKKLVQYLPDDTFYYLVLGKNFATLGHWTFDGVEPATGFHLLWGYMVAGLYRLAPAITLHGVLLAAGTLGLVCAVLATRLMVETARRIFGEQVEMGVALVCLSSIALLAVLYLMETAVALLLSALVLDLLCRTESPLRRWGPALAFALGVLGIAARSEFGLLPLCLLLMQIVLWRRGASSAAMVALAAAALAGSVAAELGLALHTHWISGAWVQASVQEKLFWSRNQGFSLAPVGWLLGDFFNATYNVELNPLHYELLAMWKWVPIAVLIVGLGWVWWRVPSTARRGMMLGVAGVLGAFAFFYRWNCSGIQPWYIGVIEAPLAVLAAGGLSFYARRWRRLALLATAGLCGWGVWHSYPAQFPWQRPLWNAGMYVRAHPELRPVGAWNTGIIAYFAGGGVTNLDGLVNDSILPYEKSGTLLAYVQKRRLRAIVDYSTWFAPFIARNGGYANGDLERCLQTVDFLKGDPDVDPWNAVRLYLVKPECAVSRAAGSDKAGQESAGASILRER